MNKQIFIKTAFLIAVPIVIQNLISLGLNLVDTIMIGELGVNELAAVGAANKVYFIFSTICFGIYSGGAIYVSQYWGKGDVASIKKVMVIDYWIGLSLSIVVCGVAFIFADSIIWLFAKEPVVIALGSEYLRITCFTYILTAVSFAINFNSRSIHQLKLPTLINALALICNTVLNYGLIFGNFGLPRLGVSGAAIATLIARFVEFVLMLLFVYGSGDHPLAVSAHGLLHVDVTLFKKLMRTALPVVASEGAWSIGTSVFYIAYGLLGTSAIAVVQVASVVNDLFQCMFFGVGNASAVMIGNELGRNREDLAYHYGKIFTMISFVLCIFVTFGLLASRNLIIDFYNYDASTNALLYDVLAVYAWYMTPKMIDYTLVCGALRSGGDTKFCMILDFIGIWVVAIPLSFFGAVVLKLPLAAVVSLSFCDELIKALVVLFRFKSRKWIKLKLNQALV